MVDRSYSDHSIEGAIRIVGACLQAGKPERIIPALLDRCSPESIAAELGAEPSVRPPKAADDSIFGGPTPEQRDALAAAIKKRFDAMAGKSA